MFTAGVMLGSQARQLSAVVPQEVQFDLAKLRTRLKSLENELLGCLLSACTIVTASCCAELIAGCDVGLTAKATISSSAGGGGV